MDNSSNTILQTSSNLELQLKAQRRTVDFDTFDIQVQQLVQMLSSGQVKISPAYQRKFRWGADRCSQFIESIMLGIPIPSLFMATNEDNSWEVVDGVQRLSTIIKFAGTDELRTSHKVMGQLRLEDLKKLKDFNGLTIEDFPSSVRQHFNTRPIKVVTLNDKSDLVVRYDLFERLNTGGIPLSPQEIRDCVFQGDFANKIEEWARDHSFTTAVRLTSLQQRDATAEECVLRFFAFRANYKIFDHAVGQFLSEYMEESSKLFNYAEADKVFKTTFAEVARVFPNGIRRPGGKMTTPLNLFEGVAVGASLALEVVPHLNTDGLQDWLASTKLRKHTTGATNDRNAVIGRIEFCRDRFMGKPYVPSTAD